MRAHLASVYPAENNGRAFEIELAELDQRTQFGRVPKTKEAQMSSYLPISQLLEAFEILGHKVSVANTYFIVGLGLLLLL